MIHDVNLRLESWNDPSPETDILAETRHAYALNRGDPSKTLAQEAPGGQQAASTEVQGQGPEVLNLRTQRRETSLNEAGPQQVKQSDPVQAC